MIDLRYITHRGLIMAAGFGVAAVAVTCLQLLFSPSWWQLLLVVSACIGLLAYAGYRWIYLPYKETERMLGLFADGYVYEDIDKIKHPLSPGMQEAMTRLKDMLDTNELISSTRKQAQYIALQNQINPHFLYNTLEGIRGEALMAGMDNIANMTEALATFYRYTISNIDQLVTLEEELNNIENYFAIQKYRFGDRISLEIEMDEADREQLYNYRMPKITLQPIIENAIIHGVEGKVGDGRIGVKLEATSSRLIITVSDNGMGIGEAQLVKLNKRLNTPSFDYEKPEGRERGGIAIVNVNNRIQLLFGEEYGVVIYSTPDIGTDVEVTLPIITGNIGDRG